MVLSICFPYQKAGAQFIIGVKGESVYPDRGYPVGIAVTVGRQMKMSMIEAGLGYGINHRMHFDLSLLSRIYGNGNHSFNIYLGAGATGAEIGFYPVIQAEGFLMDRISLYADIRTPYYPMMENEKFEVRYALGLRYLL